MFLKSIPDVCMITSRRGELTVEGVASQGNSHIGRLVSQTGGKGGGRVGEGWRGNPGLSGPIRRGGNVAGLRPAFPRAVGDIPLKPQQSTPSAGPKTAHPHNSLPKKEAEAPVIRSRPSLNLNSRKEKLNARPQPEDGAGNFKVWIDGKWVVGGEANPMTTSRQVKINPTADKPKAEWDDLVITVPGPGALGHLEAKLLQMHLSPSSTSFSGGAMPPGDYFSAEVEPGLVRRVKVKKLDSRKHTATCLVIDYYNEEVVVPWNCLVPLPQEFWPTKTQAGAPSACPGANEARSNNNNNDSIKDTAGRGSLEPQVLPSAGQFYGCVLSHVVGPSEVYLQPAESLPAYTKMHNQLLAFYSSGRGVSVVNPVPDMVVASRVGEAWSRARIIMKLTPREELLVKLVDSGKVEIVPLSSIKVLEKEFLTLPRQAFKARLDGIKKGGEEAAVWLRMFSRGQRLVGHVKARQAEKLTIDLLDDSDSSINQQMIRLGLVKKKDD